jgi:hypothetical protein
MVTFRMGLCRFIRLGIGLAFVHVLRPITFGMPVDEVTRGSGVDAERVGAGAAVVLTRASGSSGHSGDGRLELRRLADAQPPRAIARPAPVTARRTARRSG